MSTTKPQHDDDKRAQALLSFDQAMATVPDSQKMEYMEALQKCPHLVRTESDPMKFLRLCGFNIWAAIERLCKYWRERKDLFQERAFLPMTMDGKGALTHEDILVLEAGFPAVLPRTKEDRPVILCDRSKWLPSSTTMNRNRACFYTVQLLSEDEKTQQPVTEGGGILIFVDLVQPRLLPMDFNMVKRQSQNFLYVYPAAAEVHPFCALPRTMKRAMVGTQMTKQEYITNVISFAYGCSGSNFKTTVHYELNDGDFRNIMLGLGCRLEGIPTSHGGSWSFLQSQQWYREQALREGAASHQQDEESSATGGTDSITNHAKMAQEANSPKARKNKTTGSKRARKNCAANSSEEPSTKKRKWTYERMRSVNALHSRKKRERRRQEEEAMKEESKQLQTTNTALKAEHERLQSLLAKAQEIAASYEVAQTTIEQPDPIGHFGPNDIADADMLDSLPMDDCFSLAGSVGAMLSDALGFENDDAIDLMTGNYHDNDPTISWRMFADEGSITTNSSNETYC